MFGRLAGTLHLPRMDEFINKLQAELPMKVC